MSDDNEIDVEFCWQCPFVRDALSDDTWCYQKGYQKGYQPKLSDDYPKPPDWCPLRSRPTVVSLKEKP